MTRTLRVLVAYDGTAYYGWQRQPDVPTIQHQVEDALAAVLDEPVVIEGSGRTDRGVHAHAHPASFETARPLPLERILLGANRFLPGDIAIRQVAEMPAGFHARFSARGKTYRYSIFNGPVRDPLVARSSVHEPRPLVVGSMHAAAAAFVGTHDMAALATLAKEKEETVRTIARLTVRRRPGQPELIDIDVTGDGFLYNQVRTLAGTLLEVGAGTRLPSSCAELLRARDRTKAGPNLPPEGLCLLRVDYDAAPLTRVDATDPTPTRPVGGTDDRPAGAAPPD